MAGCLVVSFNNFKGISHCYNAGVRRSDYSLQLFRNGMEIGDYRLT